MVRLNQHYTTASGRKLRTLHYVLSFDRDTMESVHCVKILEDIPGQPLPKMHIQPTALVNQLIADRLMVAVAAPERPVY